MSMDELSVAHGMTVQLGFREHSLLYLIFTDADVSRNLPDHIQEPINRASNTGNMTCSTSQISHILQEHECVCARFGGDKLAGQRTWGSLFLPSTRSAYCSRRHAFAREDRNGFIWPPPIPYSTAQPPRNCCELYCCIWNPPEDATWRRNRVDFPLDKLSLGT